MTDDIPISETAGDLDSLRVSIPEYITFTVNEDGHEGLLVDQRTFLMVKLNRAGVAAWDAAKLNSWSKACEEFASISGRGLEDSALVLRAFVLRLAEKGWLIVSTDE